MNNEFQKPFAPPPAIFGVAFFAGLGIDFVYPSPAITLWLQLGIGAAIVLGGILIVRSSMQSIARGGTTYNPYAESTALVTSGIYNHTRNPGYLGLAIIQIGLAVMIDSPWIVITTFIAIVIINQYVIKLEEKKLGRAFGQEYQVYVRKVRRWI